MMALALLSLSVSAQTQSQGGQENPRGIYKMTTITGKMGEINAPYDQYKVCTDSITLMVSVDNNTFHISNNDRKIFNYTGDQPKSEEDKSTLIYNSNAEHFTQKWWSQYPNHIYFPNNDWCIEKYEAGKYSETGRIAFDALNGKASADPANPLIGTWRLIGYMDELRNVKKEVARLYEQYPKSRYFNCYLVLTPKNLVIITGNGGATDKITYEGKKAYKMGNKISHVKWLSKDHIAVEEHIDYRTDWQILERVTDGQSPLSRIASQYLGRSRQ